MPSTGHNLHRIVAVLGERLSVTHPKKILGACSVKIDQEQSVMMKKSVVVTNASYR